MPIAFPPQDRGEDWILASNVAASFNSNLTFTDMNVAAPGVPFDITTLAPGLPIGCPVNRGLNLRNLGFDYEDPARSSVVNVAFDNGVPQLGVYQTDWADANRSISGVSRDSAGSALAACRVELYATGSDQPIALTTSDGSGAFSFGNPGTGPFYIVAYKSGSPDVAGTTVNTLLPTPA